MKRGFRFVICMLLSIMCMSALAQEEVQITELRMEGEAGSYVVCPVVTLTHDEVLSASVNQLIQQNACIMEYTHVLLQVTEGSTGLKMDYEMTTADAPVVSIVFSANGKMLSGRPSQKYYPMVIDLESGLQVNIDQVFKDTEEAMWALESYMEERVSPILSTHMENMDLLPVPMEQFTLDEEGITFYYDHSQLSFLSGFSGAVTIPYFEIEDLLNLEKGSVLDKMGYAKSMLEISEETAEKIASAAENGKLAALPPVVGMPMEDAFTAFRSTVDAGFYPGGAYYEMEDARLRDALLLTDDQQSVVTGIYAKNISLWGITTGVTPQGTWREILGEPQFTMEMGETDGEMYLLCAGNSDYYDFGEYTLQLHADENNILYAAVLTD